MNENAEKKICKGRVQLKVRLSPDEHAHIKKLTESYGESVQNLFRKMILGIALPTVVLQSESGAAILSELKRIGNNINQIAKHLNQGSSKGWYTEIEDATTNLDRVCDLIRGHLGHC